MDRDGIIEPERKVGEVRGKDFLDLGAENFAFGAIGFRADLRGEGVNLRIAIAAAVGPVRRNAPG